jgi:D-glycerate 3-kinase
MTGLTAQPYLREFLQREQLPDNYLHYVEQWYQPLANDIALLQDTRQSTLVVGVQGAQGTGKSTLAALLAIVLQEEHGLVVARLSLDDFYLGHAARLQLAQDVHPLLATRGVPGTHDTTQAMATLAALLHAGGDEVIALPRFDKANDDCCDPQDWEQLRGPVDVVILEGWCLAAPPEDERALLEPLNSLERELDADGRWRAYVNRQLAGPYRELFAHIDFLVVLQAPSFACVYRWRGLQEQKLAARGQGSRVMDTQQLAHFIAHYERLTRHCLAILPPLAQRVYQLDREHHVIAAEKRSVQQSSMRRDG